MSSVSVPHCFCVSVLGSKVCLIFIPLFFLGANCIQCFRAPVFLFSVLGSKICLIFIPLFFCSKFFSVLLFFI